MKFDELQLLNDFSKDIMPAIDDDINVKEIEKQCIININNILRIFDVNKLENNERLRNKINQCLRIKECQASSRIEGLFASTRQLVLYMADNTLYEYNKNVMDDIVGNYNSYDFEKLQLDIAPTNKAIKKIHKTLMVSDDSKARHTPGRFRRKNVCIYTKYGHVHNFPQHSKVSNLIHLYDKIIENNYFNMNLRLSSAMHGLYEIIHPFTDGNGRSGRTLMQLMVNYCLNNTYYINTIANEILNHQQEYYAVLANLEKDKQNKDELIKVWKEFTIFILNRMSNAALNDLNLIIRIIAEDKNNEQTDLYYNIDELDKYEDRDIIINKYKKELLQQYPSNEALFINHKLIDLILTDNENKYLKENNFTQTFGTSQGKLPWDNWIVDDL